MSTHEIRLSVIKDKWNTPKEHLTDDDIEWLIMMAEKSIELESKLDNASCIVLETEKD